VCVFIRHCDIGAGREPRLSSWSHYCSELRPICVDLSPAVRSVPASQPSFFYLKTLLQTLIYIEQSQKALSRGR